MSDKMRRFILTGLLLLVATHQSTSFVDSHCDDDGDGSYEKGYKIERSYREEIENTLKNDIGNSDRRVALSRYHSGTENSRIYKERNSNKERSGNEARGFPMSHERSVYAHGAFKINGQNVRRRSLDNIIRSSETRRNADRRQGMAKTQRQNRVDIVRNDRLLRDNNARGNTERTTRRFRFEKQRDFRDMAARRSIERTSTGNMEGSVPPTTARFIIRTDRRLVERRINMERRRESNNARMRSDGKMVREDVRITMERSRRSLERDFRSDNMLSSSERRKETRRQSVDTERTRDTRFEERSNIESRRFLTGNNRFRDVLFRKVPDAERRRYASGVGETRRGRLAAAVSRQAGQRQQYSASSPRMVERRSLLRDNDARRFINLGTSRSSMARDNFRRFSEDRIVSVRQGMEKYPMQRVDSRRSSSDDVRLIPKRRMIERFSLQRDDRRSFSRDESRQSSPRLMTGKPSTQDSRRFNERMGASQVEKERIGDRRMAVLANRRSNIAKFDNALNYAGFDFVRAICVIMMISQLAMYGRGEKSKLSFGRLLGPFSGWKSLKVE